MFAERLKSLRKSKDGLSQAKLADELGVTQQAVGRWEKGLNMPDNAILVKLADYFHVTIDYLQGREEKRLPFVALPVVGNIIKMFAALSPQKQEQAASYIAFLAQDDKKA